MSLKFKHGSDAPKQSVEMGNENCSIEYYPTPANVRTITFIDNSGVQETLFYSDLTSIRYDPIRGSATLVFIKYNITFKGRNLDVLVHDLKKQLPQTIKVQEKRYETICAKDEVLVTELTVDSK